MLGILISVVLCITPEKVEVLLQRYGILEYYIGTIIGAVTVMVLHIIGDFLGYLSFIALNLQ